MDGSAKKKIMSFMSLSGLRRSRSSSKKVAVPTKNTASPPLKLRKEKQTDSNSKGPHSKQRDT